MQGTSLFKSGSDLTDLSAYSKKNWETTFSPDVNLNEIKRMFFQKGQESQKIKSDALLKTVIESHEQEKLQAYQVGYTAGVDETNRSIMQEFEHFRDSIFKNIHIAQYTLENMANSLKEVLGVEFYNIAIRMDSFDSFYALIFIDEESFESPEKHMDVTTFIFDRLRSDEMKSHLKIMVGLLPQSERIDLSSIKSDGFEIWFSRP